MDRSRMQRDTPRGLIGTRVDIFRISPPDSLTDPELAGPVQLLRSGKFDIPIERLTGVEVPAGSPRGTITLPLFKGRGEDAVWSEARVGTSSSMQTTRRRRTALA